MNNTFYQNQYQSHPVFLSRPNAPFNSNFDVNVKSILGMKKLSIEMDKATGKMKSKDGRKVDPNTPLANEIAVSYRRYETLHVKLRSICTTTNHSGMLVTHELTALTYADVCGMLEYLRQAGVIERYTKYSMGTIFVQFKNEAVEFYLKHFADIYLCDVVRRFIHPYEIYREVTLLDTAASNYSTLKCDLVFRKDRTVKFVISALSTNILLPAQLERLRRISNRLRKNVIRWNRGELPVALIHPASAGHGLNLQDGGSTFVWYGLTWSLELYQQANARLWRQDQKDTVVIMHIITKGTIDERIIKALSDKDSTQQALIEAVKANI